jgi:hypothetical protein
MEIIDEVRCWLGMSFNEIAAGFLTWSVLRSPY